MKREWLNHTPNTKFNQMCPFCISVSLPSPCPQLRVLPKSSKQFYNIPFTVPSYFARVHSLNIIVCKTKAHRQILSCPQIIASQCILIKFYLLKMQTNMNEKGAK